jgi:hypothetical protein
MLYRTIYFSARWLLCRCCLCDLGIIQTPMQVNLEESSRLLSGFNSPFSSETPSKRNCETPPQLSGTSARRAIANLESDPNFPLSQQLGIRVLLREQSKVEVESNLIT